VRKDRGIKPFVTAMTAAERSCDGSLSCHTQARDTCSPGHARVLHASTAFDSAPGLGERSKHIGNPPTQEWGVADKRQADRKSTIREELFGKAEEAEDDFRLMGR